jgi:hypothetical protein
MAPARQNSKQLARHLNRAGKPAKINGLLGGNGAFPGVAYPSQQGVRLLDITDGLSNTIGMAEVKAFNSYLVRSGTIPPSAPDTPADVLALGGTFMPAGDHTSPDISSNPTRV